MDIDGKVVFIALDCLVSRVFSEEMPDLSV